MLQLGKENAAHLTVFPSALAYNGFRNEGHLRIIAETEENVTRKPIAVSVTHRHQANGVIIIFAVLCRPQNSRMR